MKPRHLRRHLGLALGQRVDLAVLDHLDDLLLDRLADPLQLLRAPVERELGDRAPRLADPRRGPAVGGDPEPVGALELHQVGEQLELRRERVRSAAGPPSSRSYAAPMRATVCLPTYNELENLEPMVRALARRAPGRRPRARDRRRLARRHRRARRPARGRARRSSTSCTAPRRRASARPTSPASAARSPTAPSSCSRWTATSRTTRPTCRG